MRLGCVISHGKEGYGAFTVSASQREAVRQYIQQQAEHHRTRTFREEIWNCYVEAAWNLMNATFNPAPLPGLAAFYCRPPVVCTTG